MKNLFLSALVVTAGLTGCGGEPSSELDAIREAENANTAYLVGGGPTGTFVKLALNMASVLSDDNLRVIAMNGQGSRQAFRDLLFLDNVDVVMMDPIIREHNIRNNLIPEVDLRRSVQYVTALYAQELHLVVRDGIQTVQDLEGRRVNFGPETSGTFIAATLLFNDLGVQVDPVTLQNSEGLEALLRGDVDAMVRVVGQPTSLFSGPTRRYSGSYLADYTRHAGIATPAGGHDPRRILPESSGRGCPDACRRGSLGRVEPRRQSSTCRSR